MFSNVFWNTVNDKLKAVVGSMQLISDRNLGRQRLFSQSDLPGKFANKHLGLVIFLTAAGSNT